MLTRRSLLKGFGLTLASCALSPWLRPGTLLAAAPSAAVEGSGLNFIFVVATGGWDPLCVFAPQFGSSSIDMEPSATASSLGGLSFVDHGERPNVRSFLTRWNAKTLFINGISVSSLSHEVSMHKMLTGSTADSDCDWGTRLADARAGDFTLPHLVLGGPSFPGNLGAGVSRVGSSGQLNGLLSGAILDTSDQPTGHPDVVAERILDNYLTRRSAARVASARGASETQLLTAFDTSLGRAIELKDAQYEVDFTPGYNLLTQAIPAVRALQMGLSRCVSLNAGGFWDTHIDNTQQTGSYEALFMGLAQIMDLLETTTGQSGRLLSEETLVVVLSEFGRTPRFNASEGRDHWPYTSALLIGPGITGGRVVGAFDDVYYGRGVEPTTAEVDDGSPAVTPAVLGSTLLTLAGLDSQDVFPGIEPLTGILS